MRLRAQFRAWRLSRAELALADAEHDYDKWIDGWNAAPSREREGQRRIERARKRVERLAVPTSTDGREHR